MSIVLMLTLTIMSNFNQWYYRKDNVCFVYFVYSYYFELFRSLCIFIFLRL